MKIEFAPAQFKRAWAMPILISGKKGPTFFACGLFLARSGQFFLIDWKPFCPMTSKTQTILVWLLFQDGSNVRMCVVQQKVVQIWYARTKVVRSIKYWSWLMAGSFRVAVPRVKIGRFWSLTNGTDISYNFLIPVDRIDDTDKIVQYYYRRSNGGRRYKKRTYPL